MANPIIKMLILLVVFHNNLVVANRLHYETTYAFMSAQDLYDALEIEAPIAVGYMLGIVDGLKNDVTSKQCFKVPLDESADRIIRETFMSYWLENVDFKANAGEALKTAMSRRFPCEH